MFFKTILYVFLSILYSFSQCGTTKNDGKGLFTEAGSYHMNMVPFSGEHRDTQTERRGVNNAPHPAG